jgi:hypothetical protein
MNVRIFKTIFLSALGTILAFSAVTYTSCNPDKCTAIVCAYGGTCNNGTCNCLPGYTGANCQTKVRDKYVGIWQVNETGTITNNAQFTVSVDTAQTGLATDLVINNFYNRYTTPVRATCYGNDSLLIPLQTVNHDQISGWATYRDVGSIYGQHGVLTVSFSVVNSSNVTDDFGTVNGSPAVWNK